MKRLYLFVILIILTGLFARAAVENNDKPANGVWNFNLENVWSVSEYGDEIFASIGVIRVDDDGKVFVHDGKNGKYLIFSADGKFIKSFGKKGEGPGEIKWVNQARFWLIGDKVIVADADKIHYFSKAFDYLRSVRNVYFQRRPSFFIDEDRFVSAPLLIERKKDADSRIRIINLKTGEEKDVARFDIYQGGRAQKGEMRVLIIFGGITPMMTIGYDYQNQTLYYGMNDNYAIDVCSLDGKKLNSFSLDREATEITSKQKKDLFQGESGIPDSMKDQILKQLPDTGTYFNSIQVTNGLVYIYCDTLKRANLQKIDIFSKDGKYLYRAEIKIEEGNTISGGPLIKDGFMYMGIEDENGDYTLNKYKVQLPAKM